MFENITNRIKEKLKIDDFLNKKKSSFLESNESEVELNNNEDDESSEIEEEVIEKKETVEKKIIKQSISTAIKAQIKVYLAGILTSLISVLLPFLIILFITLLVLVVIYYAYITSLQNQYAQEMNKQQNAGSVTSIETILGSHETTQGGSGQPIGSPTVGNFRYSTFKFHQDYENVTAIDFTPSVSGDTEVRATQAGTILFIGDAGGKRNISGLLGKWCPVKPWGEYVSYGNAVIIGNKDTGYSTVYLHFDTVNPDLKVGDSIGYGTFIGYMGNTGCSSGKHLHYEIRSGKSVSDISTFPSYGVFGPGILGRKGYPTVGIDNYLSSLGDSIVSESNGLYKVDFTISGFENITLSLNSGNFSQLSQNEQQLYGPYIAGRPTPCGFMQTYKTEGKTEEERAKYMLEKRATPEFKNYDNWLQAGLDGRVQPSMLICMGIKESNLGQRLKSTNNVGNVGNTDSGATRDFPTAYDGIYAMTDLALNGRYLKNINELIKLSKCGNSSRAPVYATSDTDFNNLLGCISSIKNANIPDNWNFRLTNSQIEVPSVALTAPQETIVEDFISDTSITKFVSPEVSYIYKSYKPSVVTLSGEHLTTSKTIEVRSETKEALNKLANEYYKETNNNIPVISGYRDYNYQLNIEKTNTECVITHFCAKAGFSEHQSGLAVDLWEVNNDTTKDSFLKKYSIQYKWLKENAHLYGFTQSYQNGVGVEGYVEEPWHWRYVGVNLATKLKNQNLSLTQYYKLQQK